MLNSLILSERQRKLCLNTISSSAFYYLVCDHIQSKTPMSVVRMGDGEGILLREKFDNFYDRDAIAKVFGDVWAERMGMIGLQPCHLYENLKNAALNCTYFAPNHHGIFDERFNLYDIYPERTTFVDNFYTNLWTVERIQMIYSLSDGILFINRDTKMGEALKNLHPNKNFDYIQLTNWDQAEWVIEQAKKSDKQLILFSGSKHLGPEIAKAGKVVIDIGNAAHRWIV